MKCFASCTSIVALSAILLVGTASTLQAATVLHHYSFDSDFTDDSGNANALTASSGTPNITNAVGDFVFGGGALNLNQSGTEELLAFTSTVAFDGNSSWSISWWSQRQTIGGASGGIVGTTADSKDFIFTPNNNSNVRIRLRSSSNVTRDFGGAAYGSDYEHFAASFDDDTGLVTVWRNGVNLGSPAWGGNVIFTHVGGVTAAKKNSFDGRIDELWIFDGVLSDAEVSSLRSVNSLSLSIVPEPESYLLALIAIGGFGVTWRRCRK